MDENKKTADKAPLYFVGDFGEKERNGGTFRSFFPSETLAAPLCKTPTKPDNKGAKPHECVAHSDVMTNQVKCTKGPTFRVVRERKRRGGGAKNERKNESDKQLYLGSVDGELRRTNRTIFHNGQHNDTVPGRGRKWLVSV